MIASSIGEIVAFAVCIGLFFVLGTILLGPFDKRVTFTCDCGQMCLHGILPIVDTAAMYRELNRQCPRCSQAPAPIPDGQVFG